LPENATSAALIIGFTIQGLAIARALSRSGVRVYALVKDEIRNSRLPKHPVYYTRHAEFFYTNSLSGERLVESLIELRRSLPEPTVVLYAANDLTVLTLSASWPELGRHYALSWADCRGQIERVVRKSNLPSFCEKAGVACPVTLDLPSPDHFDRCLEQLSGPILVKPSTQAAAFKARRCATPDEFRRFVEGADRAAFPLVAQQWIGGPDTALYFYSCFAERGNDYFGLCGKKVRSSPPGVGIATVIETTRSDDVRDAARRLLRAFDISGPVAMEFKRDDEGVFWFIEANVGRTEYCVDLSICAGFNLPYVEHCFASGYPLPEVQETLECIWFDTDKEPFSYLALCAREKTMQPHGKRPVFPYIGRERLVVQLAALFEIARKFWTRLAGKIGGRFT